MKKKYDNLIVMGKSGAGKQPRIDVLIRTFGLKQLSTGNIFRSYLGCFNALGYEGDLDRFHDDAAPDFLPDDQIKAMLGIAGQENAAHTILGMKVSYYVNQGLFVPDSITNALFDSAFRGTGYRKTVLDGYPRTVEQARFLLALADQHNVRIDAILLVENDDDAIIHRTLGRRICTVCGEVYHVEFRPPPENGARCYGCGSECHIIQRSDDSLESLRARLNEFHTKARPALDLLVDAGIPLYTVSGNLPAYTTEAVESSVFKAMGIS